MKMLSVVLVPLLLVCLAIGAVHAAPFATPTVVARAQTWLGLIDDGHFAKSWQTASGYFRAAVSEADWTAALAAARSPLGALIQRRHTGSQLAASLPGAPDGEYCVMTFSTVLAQKKAATETVTFMLEPDGQWRAAGYFIK